MVDTLIKKKYDEELEDIYHRHLLINVNELDKVEEELYDKQLYIPVCIRRVLKNNYYNSPLFKEYEDKVLTSRKYKGSEQVQELMDWLGKHKEYENLLNEKVYNNLKDNVSALKKEYEEALLIIG